MSDLMSRSLVLVVRLVNLLDSYTFIRELNGLISGHQANYEREKTSVLRKETCRVFVDSGLITIDELMRIVQSDLEHLRVILKQSSRELLPDYLAKSIKLIQEEMKVLENEIMVERQTHIERN